MYLLGHLIKPHTLPFIRLDLCRPFDKFKLVIILHVKVEVRRNLRISIRELSQNNLSSSLQRHPRINPNINNLRINRLISQVKLMMRLQLDVGRPFDILQLLVTSDRPVSPDPDQIVVVGDDVDGLPIGLVGQHQIRGPELVVGEVDHVDAAPIKRVPGQVVRVPAQHDLALEVRLFDFVVHFDDVVDRQRGVDGVRGLDVRRVDDVRVGCQVSDQFDLAGLFYLRWGLCGIGGVYAAGV